MTEKRQNADLIIGEKKGFNIYSANPSIPQQQDITRTKKVTYGNEKRGYVVDENGQVLSSAGALFYEYKEVDDTKFVKLFLAGIKQAAGLTKPGLDLFEVVYKELQNRPGEDQINLNLYIATEHIKGLHERQYQRGLRELLNKEFLFRSPSDGVFFVNINFMFNGDRLTFVKGYRRKSANQQEELKFSNPGQQVLEEKS